MQSSSAFVFNCKSSLIQRFLIAKVLSVLTLFFFLAPAGFAQQWSMGYWTPFDDGASGPTLPPNAIQWGGVTHVIYTGGNILSNGSLDLTSYGYPTNAPTLISSAHANGVKVIFGVIQCDWCPNYNSNNIQNAIQTNLNGLVNNIMSVVNQYGFDGVDIDWEPYSGSQATYMGQLLSALRNQLGTSRVLTSTAMWEDQGSWTSLVGYLDRLNIMTYDLSVPSYGWPYSWFNAATYSDLSVNDYQPSLDLLVNQYAGAGIPLSKIGVGIPFYGWYCTNVSGPRQTAGWSTASCNQVFYHHMADMGFNISNPTIDSVAQVPWVYQNGYWLNFDNAQSVAGKVQFAKNKGIGGWIIWNLEGDYFPTQTPTQPLLDAIKNAMGGTTSAPSITNTSLPAATQGTAYSTTLAASGGTPPYTWSISAGSLPTGLGLGASTGTIAGTPTGTGTSSFTVKITDAAARTATQALSITVNASTTITISPTTLPNGTQNTAYSATLTAIGGAAPYTWSVASGSLPAGLKLGSSTTNTVVISGTPTTSGVSSFTVQVTDPGTPTGSEPLSINVMSTAPFAYWKLDDGSGSTASDSSGNANTLTLANSPSWLSGSSCMVSGCLSFNGTSQSASAASLNLSDTNVITVAFWMYWNAFSNNDALALESTTNFNNATTGFMIDPNSSQSGGTQFEAGLNGNAGYNQVLFARPSAGAWHHYVFVFNKGAAVNQVIPYVDGVAVAYTQYNGAANTNNFGSDPFYLMSRAGSSLFGGGRLDDVRIYKRVLSASEVQSLASVTPPPSITTTSLPTATQSTAYSATLAATGGSTPYTWSIASGTLPSGLALASATGIISGTPTTSGTSSFTVKVTDSAARTATQALSITVNVTISATITIAPTSLQGATQNTAYSATLTATGGASPYTWSISSGSLPAGLTLGSSTSNSVVISGTPTTAGTSSFTVQVTGGGGSGSQALSIAVIASSPFAYWKLDDGVGSTASDSSGNANTLTLANSPAWLSSSSCMVNGCLSFNGTSQSASAASLNLSDTNVITVAFWMNWNAYSNNDAMAMESTTNFNNATTGFMIDPNSSQSGGTQFEAGVNGNVGYNQVLFARPSAGAWHHYAFVFNKGAAVNQVIPYVDGVAVAYTQSASAANTNNFGSDPFYLMSRAGSSLFGGGRLDDVRIYKRMLSASEIQSLASVTAPPPSITTTSLPSGEQSTAYSATLAATGGTSPYTWSLASGTLPSGVTLSSTGVISGTPTSAGTCSFTVKVTDAASLTATQALTMTMNAGVSITTTSLPSGIQNVAYSATLTATGGTAPYTWSISSGTLPAGLTLSSTGAISGSPTGTGTSSFSVAVTDAIGCVRTQALSITVNTAVSITTSSLPSGVRNTSYSTTLAATGGTTPYTWSLASGSLPSGLTLASTGVISGTPTTRGTYSFTVKVTDANSMTATKALSIYVSQH